MAGNGRFAVILGLMALPAVAHAGWVDMATVSSTLGNQAGRLCVGAGRTDLGCPASAPALDLASGALTMGGLLSVPQISATAGIFSGDLTVRGNLFVSGSQTIEGVTFANGGVSATGTVTATSFAGDGSGLTGVVASSADRLVSGTTTVQVVSSSGFVSITQAGTNTGWFDPQRGLVTLGVSSTGPISGTQGYFGNGPSGVSLNNALGSPNQTGGGRFLYSGQGAVTLYHAGLISYFMADSGVKLALGATGTGGTPAIMISGTNVGMGTANPAATLDVSGSSLFNAPVLISTTANSGMVRFYNGTATGYVGQLSSGNNMFLTNQYAGNLYLATSDTTRVIIRPNGDVGIGLLNPSATLHVSGTTYITSAVTIGTYGAGSAMLQLAGNGSAGSSLPQLSLNNTGASGSNWSVISTNASNGVGGGRLQFLQQGSASVDAPVTIYGQSVGINGVGTPSTTLQVSGSLRLAAETSATLNTCDANRTGAIKYESGDFSVCRNGATWETLTAIAQAAASVADRISSGTTTVQVVSSSGFVSLTQAGTNTGWFDPTRGLVTLGVSATGTVSGTAGYFSSRLGIGMMPVTSLLAVSGSVASMAIVPTGDTLVSSRNLYLMSNNGWIYLQPNGSSNTVLTASSNAVAINIATSIPSATFHVSGSILGTSWTYLNANPAVRTAAAAPLEVSGTVSATRFVGDGSGLTNISASAISGISADRLTSGSSIAALNSDTGVVSLTQAGTTWGYLVPSGWSYLPQLNTGWLGTTGTVSTNLTLNSMGGNQNTISFQRNSSQKWQLGLDTSPTNNFFLWDQTATRTMIQALPSGSLSLMPSGGNVGIGTTAPSRQLEVSGSAPYVRLGNSNGLYSEVGGYSGNLQLVTYNSARDIQFYAGGSQTAVLKGTGLMGIGNTDPSTGLHVNGSIRMAAESSSTLNTCDSNRTGAIRYIAGDFSVCRNGASWETLTSIAQGAAAVADRISSGTTTVQVVSSTGFVSLTQAGTNTGWFDPTRGLVTLGVSTTGPISATDGYFGTGIVNIASTTGNAVTLFKSAALQGYTGINAGAGTFYTGTTTNSPLALLTNNLARLTVTSSGLVGIGTTAPAYPFEVSGSAWIQTAGQGVGGLTVASTSGSNVILRGGMAVGNNNNIVQAGDTGLIFSGGMIGTGAFVLAPWVSATASGLRMTNTGYVGLNGIVTATTPIEVSGTVSATRFVGDGSGLTNVVAADRIVSSSGAAIINPTGDLTVRGRLDIVSGNSVVAVGQGAAQSSTALLGTTAVGYQAAQNVTTGNGLAAVGYQTGQNNAGNLVSAFGTWAAQNNTGTNVNAFGYNAARNNTSYSVIAIGNNAASNNAGSLLVAIGDSSGNNNSGAYVTAIGAGSGAANTFNNVTLLGYNVGAADKDNQVVLGNGSVVEVSTSGIYVGKGVSVSGAVTATRFVGDGSGLTNITAAAAGVSGSIQFRNGSGTLAGRSDLLVSNNGTVILPNNVLMPNNYGLYSANVSGTANLPLVWNAANDNTYLNAASGSLVFLASSTSTGLGTERMRITGAGKVGIANANPVYQLDLTNPTPLGGTQGDTSYLWRAFNPVGAANNAYLALSQFRHTAGADWTGTSLRLQKTVDSTPMGFIDYGINGQASNYGLGFGSGVTTTMVLTAAGSLGIGVITPSYPLHVSGSAAIYPGSAQFPVNLYLLPAGHATSRRVLLSMDRWNLIQDSSGSGNKDFTIYDSVSNTTRLGFTAEGRTYLPSTTQLIVGPWQSTGSSLTVVNGEIQPGSSGAGCASGNAGAIRYASGALTYCTGSTWAALASSGTANVMALSDLSDVSKSTSNLFLGWINGANANVTNTVAVGPEVFGAGTNNGFANVALGSSALYYNTAGRWNSAVGNNTLLYNTTGDYNTVMGFQAGIYNTTGTENTAYGAAAAYWNDTGSQNTSIGRTAGRYNVGGNNNTVLGHAAAQGISSSTVYNNVTAAGYRSLIRITTGSDNTAIGAYVGQNVSSGSSNTLLGYNAGLTLTTGSNNILIGNGANVPANSTSNFLNIGNTIYGDVSTGYVGIGAARPVNPLDVGNYLYLSNDNGNEFGVVGAKVAGGGYNRIHLATNFLRVGTDINDPAIELRGNKVGIGVKTPAYPLVVSGSASFGGPGAGTGFTIATPGSGNNAGYTGFYTSDSTRIGYVGYGTGAGGWLNLATDGNTALRFVTSGTESMRIDAVGNVGIGVTSPSNPLEIRRDQSASTDATIRNSSNLANAAARMLLTADVGSAVVTYNGSGSSVSAYAGGPSGLGVWTTGSGGIAISSKSASGTLRFYTGTTPTERARIDASGNVGIGTGAVSLTEKLVVNGNIKADQFCNSAGVCVDPASLVANPSGQISAFDLATCPAGWSEYTPARGRFLRGIDNGAGNDPDGTRAAGNLQDDMFKTHRHMVPNLTQYISGRTGNAGAQSKNDGTIGTEYTDFQGGSETRPKNVAVLFCRKN